MNSDQSEIFCRSAGTTHVGAVRARNEDAFLDEQENRLWVVADGMGGHDAGDVASGLLIEHLHGLTGNTIDAVEQAVLDAVANADAAMQEWICSAKSPRGMGSTIAMLAIRHRQCVCVWAGDSRIYRLRAGALRRLTHDHSEVQELIDAGIIDNDAGETHPARNIITRAVGAGGSRAPDARRYNVESDDCFLLCSDGLNGVVRDAEIAEVMQAGDPEDIVQALLHLSLTRSVSDNVTIVAVNAC